MLTETQARDILFFRALDEADTAGVFLSRASFDNLVERPETLTEAEPEQQVAALTQRLRARLEGRFGLSFDRWRGALSQGWIGFAAPFAFLIGLGSNYLGPSGRVNLLLNPFVALVGWNFAIYVLLLAGAVSPRNHRVSGFRDQAAIWLQRKLGAPAGFGGHPKQRRALLKARIVFLNHWFGECGHLSRLRFTAALHLLAAVFACGVVAGMYWRGLGQSFVFEWESTFIRDEAAVRNLLEVFFGPVLFLAKSLFPNGLPTIGQDGPAWIHLLSLTTAAYIVLPRLALTWLARRSLRRCGRAVRLNLDNAYYFKLTESLHAGRRELRLFLYSYALEPDQRDRLDQAARHLWGDLLRIENGGRLEWGETELDPASPEGLESIWLVCFNGAQTPEAEVHGALIRGLLAGAERKKAALMALADTSRLDEAQRPSRRERWGQVLTEAGLDRFAWVDLNRPLIEAATLDALAHALWRPPHE